MNRNLLPWLVRLGWLSLAATAGTALGDALDSRSTPVAVVAATLAWTTWAGGLLALLVPRPVGLVAVRVGSVAAAGAAAWSVLDAGRAGDAVLVALSAVPAVLAFLPATGEWLVNGASYGHERRYLLRAPAALLLGPVLLAGATVIAGLLAGPLLLAARAWVAGGLAVAVGVPAAAVAARALLGLAQRWIVLVPAGLVVKDHTALLDPMLFRREDIAHLRPAPADSDAADLTAGTFGLALELRLRTPNEVSQVVRRDEKPVARELEALLVTPTRPGALVADAAGRRIPT
ncbi:MAG: hypothetical protein AB7H43_12705 [Acidimicrobiia bacterium]